MKTTTRVTEDPQAGLGRGRNPRAETPLVRRLAAWCIAHRGRVLLTWLAVAIVTTVIAAAVGRNYATNFSLPGTESQRALDLLNREFPAQSGDVDTIVFHGHERHGRLAAGADRDRAAAGQRAAGSRMSSA